MSDTAYRFPSFYSDWVAQLLPGPVPSETKATCDNCAMVPKPEDGPPYGIAFDPVVRCCTYEPLLVNYRAGRILADADPEFVDGRGTVEARLKRRIGVTPFGIQQPDRYEVLYSSASESFGRAPDLRCPHLRDDGGCGIWKHRPAVCSTWFCKHVRGATGKEFWGQINTLLGVIDGELALWCGLELGLDARVLLPLAYPGRTSLKPGDLGGSFDESAYGKLWGRWLGKEADYYRESARMVERLSWSDIAALCSPRVRALASIVSDAYGKLVSEAIPERLELGRLHIESIRGAAFLISTYSGYDPVLMSSQVSKVLRYFDGRPTADALADIHRELNLNVTAGLLRRLIDFGVLREA